MGLKKIGWDGLGEEVINVLMSSEEPDYLAVLDGERREV